MADYFSEIPNEYEQLKKEDIQIDPIEEKDILQLKPVQVWLLLSQLHTNKSTVKGDLPARIFKEFAAHIAEPLTHVFNVSLMQGEYPNIYKYEICTPVPKKYPVTSMQLMRNISGLLTCDKIFEKLLSEIIIADMRENADISQFGNRKNVLIQHYLIKMIHRIQTALEKKIKKRYICIC